MSALVKFKVKINSKWLSHFTFERWLVLLDKRGDLVVVEMMMVMLDCSDGTLVGLLENIGANTCKPMHNEQWINFYSVLCSCLSSPVAEQHDKQTWIFLPVLHVFPCISHGPPPAFCFNPTLHTPKPKKNANRQLPPCRKPPKRYANHVSLVSTQTENTSVGHGVLIYWSCTTQKMNECPLKRDHFQRKIVFQFFKGFVSFRGIVWCEWWYIAFLDAMNVWNMLNFS